MLESLLQVLINRFIRYLAEQCQVRYADLFLLGNLESRLLDLRLSVPARVPFPRTEERGFRDSGRLSVSTFRLALT